MSYSISTLLTRNLQDVFGENDPARRRAAVQELYTEDGVFYDPSKGVHRGRDEIDRIAGEIRATHLDFRYQPIADPEETGKTPQVFPGLRGFANARRRPSLPSHSFKGVYRGRDEIDRVAGAIRATHPDFRYQLIARPEEVGNGGRIQWVSGRPGEAPAYAGTDFIIARDGRIAALYLFFDKLP